MKTILTLRIIVAVGVGIVCGFLTFIILTLNEILKELRRKEKEK